MPITSSEQSYLSTIQGLAYSDETYRLALIRARAWLEHFRQDVAFGLVPIASTMDVAIAEIDAVLSSPSPENRAAARADYQRDISHA